MAKGMNHNGIRIAFYHCSYHGNANRKAGFVESHHGVAKIGLYVRIASNPKKCIGIGVAIAIVVGVGDAIVVDVVVPKNQTVGACPHTQLPVNGATIVGELTGD